MSSKLRRKGSFTSIRKTRKLLDEFLDNTKWVFGTIVILLAPGVAATSFGLLSFMLTNPGPLMLVAAGALLYYILWARWLRGTSYSFYLTLEHELTHALFALLTLHKVVKIRVSGGSGLTLYKGRGNWVISLAPYFFPTTPLLVLLVTSAFPSLSWEPVRMLCLGVAFGYHVSSTLYDIHPDQSDLAKAGNAFSIAVLPLMNAVILGTLTAYTYGGPVEAYRFCCKVVQLSLEFWTQAVTLYL